ncbi:leucine-rich repeat-containing protein 41 isoform X2 [Anabas testudineus]|uniref:leucine-rich repeat-containing protein 41 isoform X2 n=1 Tax=Anabas testudineus TaxID=64144 RepID=UPI000E4595C3|nr:leucine-rich repeat-containing protein 41 isoform X2 [Anabas testudineus]
MRETARGAQQELCLKLICFQAVREHLASAAVSIKAVLDLPTPLIQDLLPHLTVCQLDELQPELNGRGISTYPGWVKVLREIYGPHHAIDLHTEEEAKHETMRMLFTLVFYGFRNHFIIKNAANLNTPAFLWAAAKCIKHFVFITNSHNPLQSLTAERRPLLKLLEKRIRSVAISQSIDISKRKSQTALYVLHRLLDHGMVKEVVIHVQCPILLAWLLHRRGTRYVNPELDNLMNGKRAGCTSQTASASTDSVGCSPYPETRASEDQDDEGIPCKRLKLNSASVEEESGKANLTVNLQSLCHASPSANVCPWGQICCLEIRHCGSESLKVLNSALPTFFCLRSLTLHSFSTFRDVDVLDLAKALKQLSESSCSSLTNLSISVLPYTSLMEILLEASPKVISLQVEIQSVMWGPPLPSHHPRTAKSKLPELPLEKLTVKVAELQTDLHFITSVLRRSPHLTSLHIAGLRLPSGCSQGQLLTTLSEVNPCLRSLNLEDMKLSDCLPEILHLLSNCKLEELRFNDCRLLEKWSNKEESLNQLVAALKMVPCLQTLSLAQNRIALTSFSRLSCWSLPGD